MLTCQQCRDELAEYALGHSAPEASAAVEEHLAACVVCRRELAETESAWAALAAELPPADLPPALLERIISRVDLGPSPRPAPAAPGRPAAALTPRQRWASYTLAASVAAALVGGALYLDRPVQIADGGAVTADAALHDLAARLGKVQELERMLRAGNVRVVTLASRAAANEPSAYVVWDLPARQWHVYVRGLAPPPPGEAYQLWAAGQGAEPLPGPTFTVDAAGLGSFVATFPTLGPGDGVQALITREPAAGSVAPSGDQILAAPL
jgi:anti-sigma-K factor RskA